LKPQVAIFTIKNISGEEVKDITISYEHASKNEKQNIKINNLSDSESKTYNLELTSSSTAIGAGIAVVSVEIEYYINGTKFNMDNGDGYIDITDGRETIVTINKNGWDVKW
jgi:uncharacterized protein YpmS